MAPRGEAGLVEDAALAMVGPLPGKLAAIGMRGERRALVLRAKDFAYRVEGTDLEVAFELPRGAFATSVLREIVDAAVPELDPD